MPTFRLGALDSRHRARLAEILAATKVFTADEIGVALELFDETFGQASRGDAEARSESPSSGYEFLGLFDHDEALAGYACYGPTPGTAGTFDLYWIAVHPAAQGGGAGGRLLGAVEGRLRERGARLLIAETSSRASYARTRRFYDTRGFRVAARVADFYAVDDDRVIYAKRLAHDGAEAELEPSTH